MEEKKFSYSKIKRKIKKTYKKYKYMDKTKARFFMTMTIISLFTLFVGGTYSYFYISKRLDTSIITIANLKYQLTSTNTNFKNNSITVGAGETLELTLDLKSLNSEHTKYALNYLCDNADVKVLYDEKREQNVLGEIGGLNSIINIKVVIQNKSSSNQTVNFELKGGYLQNILNSNITEKYVNNVMMARSSSSYNGEFWSQAANIKTITFENEMNPKENATFTYDVSKDKKGGVMSYLVPNSEDSTKYDLYIQANGNTILSNGSYLFSRFTNLQSIEGLNNVDTSIITNMSYMFSGCSSLRALGLSNFDTSNVNQMYNMFSGCNSLTELNVSNFDTSKVTSMSDMFSGCSNLTTLDVSNFNTSKVTGMSDMFSGCSSLTTLNVSNFDTSNVTNMSHMFYNCNSLTTLDVSNFDTSNVTNMRGMFTGSNSNVGKSNLKEIKGLENFNTSNVTDMSFIFQYCNGLTTLNLSNFDTSNVTDMVAMFSGCSNLTTLDVSNFDTSKVTSMTSMFSDCSNLTTLDVSNFDTNNVNNMSVMFSGCSGLTTLNLSNFNTSNVTNMSWMFSGCSNLKTLDVSDFDTSNVNNMSAMFQSCSSLTILDVSNFDTSNATYMHNMFYCCYYLTTTITIRGTKCTSYSDMFYSAATNSEASITVNYTEDASSLVDSMIATKSSNSNVVKNSQPEPKYSLSLNSTSDISLSNTEAYRFTDITVNTSKEGYVVTSFKLNGNLVQGNTFKMPAENVTISDVTTQKGIIVESEHNPYPNSLNNQEYLNKTFDGATTITVVLEYQTQSTTYDWIYLYDKNNTQYGKYGGSTLKTETITIPGDTIRIVFKTDSSGNNYYGFKATVIPNYD